MVKARKKQSFNLLTDVPYIHNTEELEMWLQPRYTIKDMMTDNEAYQLSLAKIANIVRGCFPIYECRTHPVKFRFNETERKYKELELRHFFVNMILWRPFVEISDLNVLDETHMVTDFEKVIPNINNYIDVHLINVLRDHHIKSTTINFDIADVIQNLIQIDVDFGLILGLNFTMETFTSLYEKYPEIREIMEVRFPENMQPYEIEQKLDSLQKREIEIFKSIPENPIGVILSTGTGIKHKQLAEFTISEGLKPSLEGKTIPKPIENSTLLGGLDRPSYLFLDGTGARKSLVSNKRTMGKAGYFSKITLMLARTLSMTLEVSDCGTKHLVAYEIKSKKHLYKLDKKFFKESLTDEDYQMLNAAERHDLIGKTIFVRSVATCALGDCTCLRCVGGTAISSIDIADGIAAFNSEEITKVVEQNILSTKHLLTTFSELIEFNSPFYKFFDMVYGEINPRVNNNEDVPNVADYAIWIDPNDLQKVEELDDDSLFNSCLKNGRFYIQNMENMEEAPILVQTSGEKELYITNLFMELRKSNKGYVPFKLLNDDDKLFEVSVENRELTAPLYGLMELLNKEKPDDFDETINNVSQRFLDLLIDAGIQANISAGELIINRLIRSVAHPYDRPDFTKERLEPYRIYPIYRALEKNKSATVGISFQNIKRQFLSDTLFEDRTATTFSDDFFKPVVFTEKLLRYRKYAREAKKNNLL